METKHCRDFSKEEFMNYWHQPEDYDNIKDEIRKTIDYFNKSEKGKIQEECSSSDPEVDVTSLCTRGLEHLISSESGMKTILRENAWDSVLDEQDILYDLESPNNNSEMLRKVYRISSLPASRIAQQKGVRDAIQAGYPVEDRGASRLSSPQPSTATTCTLSPKTSQNSIVSHAA